MTARDSFEIGMQRIVGSWVALARLELNDSTFFEGVHL